MLARRFPAKIARALNRAPQARALNAAQTPTKQALTCGFLGFELDPRALRRPWLAPFLTALAAAFTVAYFTLRGSSYFVFFVVIFGALSTHCCWKALRRAGSRSSASR